jgi:hypothetical protein
VDFSPFQPAGHFLLPLFHLVLVEISGKAKDRILLVVVYLVRTGFAFQRGWDNYFPGSFYPDSFKIIRKYQSKSQKGNFVLISFFRIDCALFDYQVFYCASGYNVEVLDTQSSGDNQKLMLFRDKLSFSGQALL